MGDWIVREDVKISLRREARNHHSIPRVKFQAELLVTACGYANRSSTRIMCAHLRSSSWFPKARVWVVRFMWHTIGQFYILSVAIRKNPHWTAAEHFFHLTPETLVYQSVSKRIDGGIEHNHYVRNGNCNWAELVGTNVIQYMKYGMCTPGNTKDSTYDDNCQGDSLS